jgi:hypothetical protein
MTIVIAVGLAKRAGMRSMQQRACWRRLLVVNMAAARAGPMDLVAIEAHRHQKRGNPPGPGAAARCGVSIR